MPKKLNGAIVLSKIPKELIKTTESGSKVIYVDITPKKGGADQYGFTHAISIYNKETKVTIYLGNMKEEEFGKSAQAPDAPTAPQAPGNSVETDDLPF